jgi:formylglycine-generating enzyme required for sulfatase activity
MWGGAAALLVAGLLEGCAESEARSAAVRRMSDLEQMVLVPAGSTPRRVGDPRAASTGKVERHLLVDRFEVSRSQWQRWTGELPELRGLVSDAAQRRTGRASWPAFASFDEAAAFARLRGMRLPTVSEWTLIASGGQGHRYPWGVLPRASVANTLELGLHRPLPVGTFENGGGPFGCRDLLGNVAEWAVGDGTPLSGDSEGPPVEGGAVSMGGSYDRRLRPVVTDDGGVSSSTGIRLHPRTRGPDLGLRCVADAQSYLARHSVELESLPDAQERLERLGARWGSPAVAALEALLEADPGSRALQWLLAGARR